MGVQPALPPMSVDEFLDWAEGRQGKYELEDGRVVAMATERAIHARVKFRVARALADSIAKAGLPCEAFIDAIAVRIDHYTAYVPDALVHCGATLQDDERETPSPIVVVEVLSPSTERRDIAAKLAGYFQVRTVAHYLIVDADKGMLIHHARGEGDLIATRILSEGALRLDPPGLSLDVADLLASVPA